MQIPLSPIKIAKKIKNRINIIKLKKESDKKNNLWRDQIFIFSNIDSASADLYKANKGIVELEHQVGRYLNMKEIARELVSLNIEGDILEFGTWQGTGLILLSHALKDDKIARNYIGIDSFEGLPETSTIWVKGDFSNTSQNLASENISRHILGNKPFKLIKGWFNDELVKTTLTATSKKIAIIHFDADLASSTEQALTLIEPYLLDRKDPIFFLFDDWGCHPDEVPDAFYEWLDKASKKFSIKAQKISSTRLTRYYRITF